MSTHRDTHTHTHTRTHTHTHTHQVAFGPIAWLLISEIFPLEVRGPAIAFAVQNNFFWNLVVSFLYPTVRVCGGGGGTVITKGGFIVARAAHVYGLDLRVCEPNSLTD